MYAKGIGTIGTTFLYSTIEHFTRVAVFTCVPNLSIVFSFEGMHGALVKERSYC
jgi:hypothetical protein